MKSKQTTITVILYPTPIPADAVFSSKLRMDQCSSIQNNKTEQGHEQICS